MVYKFDDKDLKYKNVTKEAIIVMVVVILIVSASITGLTVKNLSKVAFIGQETKDIIIKEADKENEFSREHLQDYIKELNLRYPHIVMAQAEIETGGFTSNIFKENHNLFGMKQATVRPTTCIGQESGHAAYKSWRESVVDYALYAASHLKEIHTEKQYLEYLRQNYAEDSTYVSKIKRLIGNKYGCTN